MSGSFLKIALLVAFSIFCSSSICVAKGPDGSGNKVDVDLAKMSGTMVYAQVYQMVMDPRKFIGKQIRMKGIFSSYFDDESKRRFYGCVIQDALACCSQGLAFELSKPRKYPQEYPAEGAEITIEGTFDYEKEEDGVSFPIIKNAEMRY